VAASKQHRSAAWRGGNNIENNQYGAWRNMAWRGNGNNAYRRRRMARGAATCARHRTIKQQLKKHRNL